MNLGDKYGKWACVAGAAEGLGQAFSESLAKRGFHLILIDKKKDELSKTVELLEGQYKIEIITLHLDLGNPESIDVVMNSIREKECKFLVYNAAYGPVKPFLSNNSDELNIYIKVNMEIPIKLIYQCIAIYKDKQFGVLLISSLAGFRGTQFVVPYAATKAWTWNLAEGLYYEFRDTGFDISVCCPGSTDTPNLRSTNPRKQWLAPKPMLPETVAEEALDKFGKKLFIIPGLTNKISHFLLSRILPRNIASSLHNATMKKMYAKR